MMCVGFEGLKCCWLSDLLNLKVFYALRELQQLAFGVFELLEV